jgi:hypothetical protein
VFSILPLFFLTESKKCGCVFLFVFLFEHFKKKAVKNLQLFEKKQRPLKKVKKTDWLFEKMKTLKKYVSPFIF